ncbi:MAG: S41 family peptidase [Bacteroidales bacterium]|nr:S41 family peptidase [Bacteroidales bacterium]
MMNKRRNKYIYLPIVFAILLALGIYVGMKLSEVSRLEKNVFTLNTPRYDKLTDIINYIDQDYVDSVNKEELVENSIVEILQELDPHSQYIPAKDFNTVNDPLQGNFEGIGIQFRIVKDTITVIHPIPGGPSEKVGLKAGDRIVKIEDTLVAGVSINNHEAMSKLKGKRGTRVNVDVYRRNSDELLDFTITRDVIPTYSLDVAYMVDEKIGYIKLNKFSATTFEEFSDAMDELLQEGMEKLILDLRGNVGGYLKAAVKIADEFLENNKLIVYTEGNSRPKNFAYATQRGRFEDQELVVLIDEGSASASEILAGAIQDNDRGSIIGRRSFGKGLVQEQLSFPDGSALRLTVARYYTPTGRCIQKPYDEGLEEYYHESYERFMNGEVLHPDSIQFADSLKYITPGGKVVYGGGGIMPDIYVPLQQDSNYVFYNKLLRRGLIYQFAFDYTDKHRQDYDQYKTYREFNRNFNISNSLFQQFIAYAAEKNVKGSAQEIAETKRKIKALLKAYFSQNLYDDKGFYPVYHQIDDVFARAVDHLKNQDSEI